MMLIAASTHMPYYVAAGVLVAWALLIGGLGIKSSKFPNSDGAFKAIAGVTVVLVAATMSAALITGETPDLHQTRPEVKLGVVPQPEEAPAAPTK